MFTDINIYSLNNKTDHISEKYIFYRKKKLIFSRFKVGYKQDPDPEPDPLFHETDPEPDPLFHETDPIHIKMKRIRGSGSISKRNGSETLIKRILKKLSGKDLSSIISGEGELDQD